MFEVTTDTLTILRGHTPNTGAKHVGLDADGRMKISTPTPSYLWNVRIAKVGGLSDLGAVLRSLEESPSDVVVRGKLLEEVEPVGVLRRKNGDKACFAASPRRWCMSDFDGLMVPPELAGDQEAMVEHAVHQLPPEFHGVDCRYQWSASMGIKAGVRLHTWHWLDQPLTDEEKKAWMHDHPVDQAVYDAVQLHYVARPIFLNGAVDPVPQRSGFYRAGRGVETVSVPDDLPERARRLVGARRSGQRSESAGGAQEILRDPVTRLVIDGRERLMFLCSLQATTESRNGGRRAANITAAEIGERTWSLFAAQADLSDGKWTKADAYGKAQVRKQELDTKEFPFTSHSGKTTLYPAPEPHYQPGFVDRDTGTALLEAALTAFFGDADSGCRTALRITMGSGKSQQAVAHLVRHLARSAGQRIEIYVPRHDLAKDYKKALLGAEVNAKVIHVGPRLGNENNELPVICLRPDYVRKLVEAKHGVYKSACCTDDGERCQFYNKCLYIAQFSDPELHEHDGNVVRIFVHNHLGLPRNPNQTDPDIVIIDEAFIDHLVKQEDIEAEEIRRTVKTNRYPRLGDLIVGTLKRREPLLDALRRAGIRPADLEGVDLDHLKPALTFDPAAIDIAPVGRAETHRRIATLLRVIGEELRNHDCSDVERVVYNPRLNQAKVCWARELDIPDHAAVLVLDATADEMLLERVLGPINLVRIDIRQRSWVTQVYDRTGSNVFWNGNKSRTDDLVTILNAFALEGERPLLVCHKTFADGMRHRPDLHKNVRVMHFGALRGSNAAEDCTVAFITGRNQPPASAIDLKARALFWSDEEPLIHDEGARFRDEGDHGEHLPTELRGYLQSHHNPRKQSGVYVNAFTDARIEALHAQSREDETVQALARLRLVHSPMMKRVFLLSNLPVEISVDHLISFDELMPDVLERELIRTGNIPLTPLGIMKMRPDLATTYGNAKKLLQRSRVGKPESLAAMPDFAQAGLVVLTFKAENAGRTNEHRHLFMLPTKASTRFGAEPARRSRAGALPFEAWKSILQVGDPNIPGTGWGEVRDAQFEFLERP